MGGRIGIPELVLILGCALLLFGANKLPELGKALGLSIKEFKKAMGMEAESPSLEAVSEQKIMPVPVSAKKRKTKKR